MAILPVNILDLLNKHKVESERIEFKAGWNPSSIYRTICAFANDIDNLGGGYILVGVEEENGLAKRPVKGLPKEKLDHIQKEIVNFNTLFSPSYFPRISIEEIDNKSILAIWVPTGNDRPYMIPSDVNSRHKQPVYYIRYGTSSIEAKGDMLDELRELSSRIPFDDRGNPNIKSTDISIILLRNYLSQVGSKLEASLYDQPITTILEQMDLLTGPSEHRMIKNVAAMMFCENPEKFYPYTQVDIVVFPEGKLNNPNRFSEVIFKGSVPKLINDSIEYIKTNIVKEFIEKQEHKAESLRYFNYPLQALEEAIVNALYHRDYTQREPVEITIEPDRISILSFSGPDRSISNDALKKGENLRSRRYRNRRLGDFLKELDLTEGRSTGIPTIQKNWKRTVPLVLHLKQMMTGLFS